MRCATSAKTDYAALHRARLQRRGIQWKSCALRGGVLSPPPMIGERGGLHVGSVTWRGAEILLDYLSCTSSVRESNRSTLRTLELGGGTGLLGVGLAAVCGDDVTLTDRDGIELLEATVARNAALIDTACGAARVVRLDWCDEGSMSAARFDRVVGADILYNASCVAPLLRTIVALIPPEDCKTLFYLCYKVRERDAEAQFFTRLAAVVKPSAA
jgi:hypothetical protein